MRGWGGYLAVRWRRGGICELVLRAFQFVYALTAPRHGREAPDVQSLPARCTRLSRWSRGSRYACSINDILLRRLALSILLIPPALLELFDGLPIGHLRHRPHSVQQQRSIEVIDLMLPDAGDVPLLKL